MAQTTEVEPYSYHFTHKLPRAKYGEDKWDRNKNLPTLESVLDACTESVSCRKELQELPERNKKLLLDMSRNIINMANNITGTYDASWTENYWGLYIVGSRARGDARSDSDLDLLSVGTFYRAQGFHSWIDGVEKQVLRGFDQEIPDELPSEYNHGDVDRKYLNRLTTSEEGVLPVDLNVVDLTFTRASFDYFKEEMDTDEKGSPLPRLPLVEVTVARR